MKRLRVGVVGAGLIGQVEHIPNPGHLRERFYPGGVCDPSPGARDRGAPRAGLPPVATARAQHLHTSSERVS